MTSLYFSQINCYDLPIGHQGLLNTLYPLIWTETRCSNIIDSSVAYIREFLETTQKIFYLKRLIYKKKKKKM